MKPRRSIGLTSLLYLIVGPWIFVMACDELGILDAPQFVEAGLRNAIYVMEAMIGLLILCMVALVASIPLNECWQNYKLRRLLRRIAREEKESKDAAAQSHDR